MKRVPDLDFALDRAARQGWRNMALAALGLIFGLQVGLAAWRLQSLQSARAALNAQHQQMVGKPVRANSVEFSADQVKVAVGAQSMLDSLAVPWEGLLSAIEQARTQRILIEAIQPHAQDGSVNISVSCQDFAAVAEFVQRLAQQDLLHDVMLVSETRPDNAGSSLRAVISAHWRNAK